MAIFIRFSREQNARGASELLHCLSKTRFRCYAVTPDSINSKHVRLMDSLSKARRSQCMAAIRSRGNKSTELKLVAIFRAYDITGWRRNSTLPGKPDFVFRSQRLAVFVDGCFWHGCARHYRQPNSNVLYWKNKIARNIARDRKCRNELSKRGWRVLRIWEHELCLPNRIAAKLFRLFRRRASK